MSEIKITKRSETAKEKAKKKTKKFMKAVEAFMVEKNGGYIPNEWKAMLELLEVYYEQFIAISLEVEDLDTLLIQTRYGINVTPLLAAEYKASQRLESILKQCGLTLKEAKKMEIIEPKKKQSALDKFMEKQNKEIEMR